MSTIINVKTIPRPHGFSLNDLQFSVCFHGNVLIQELPELIPVQISVRVEDKWAALLPAVRATPKAGLTHNGPLTPVLFPFLPLQQPMDTCQWQQLAKDIERGLLADPHLNNSYPEYYFVMRELFWMAFVAAFPMFPHGNWPLWDSQIPMEGEFISRWVLRDSAISDDEVDLSDTHYDMAIQQLVWEEFMTTVERALLIPATY